jgi:predicted small metal-binding protein
LAEEEGVPAFAEHQEDPTGEFMDKLISCWTVTEKCYYVAQGETEDEALRKLGEHLESAHQLTLTEEMRERAASLIRKAA